MELNEKGLPFFPELRFEDKRHIYTLGGQLLPSVTTVMKPLDEALYRTTWKLFWKISVAEKPM